jgi:ribosome biogenesis protein NSA1
MKCQNTYRLFVGSETGILKQVDVEKKTWCNVNSVGQIEKQFEIVGLCWNNSEQTEICRALRNQTVVIHSEDASRTLDLSGSEGPFKGFAKIDGDFLTCTESGSLRLWAQDGVQKFEKAVGADVCCAKTSDRHQVATGGKENELKIWDLDNAERPVFAAKNPQHDWLNLRKPVWVLDADFVPNTNTVVSTTSYHQVRVYDPSVQRRPVIEMEFGDSPITTVSCLPNAQQMLVGNSHGDMALLDVRGKGHIVQQYKGSLGGLRQVLCHPAGKVVASCGLDRFVRVYDVNTRHMIHKFYLKSRLNCLLFQDNVAQLHDQTSAGVDDAISDAIKDDVIKDDDDDEALWSKMEVVKANKLKRKSTAQSVREIRQAQREATQSQAATRRTKMVPQVHATQRTMKKSKAK